MSGASATPAAHAYPRPQLRRAAWISLDGEWEFALDREARWTRPGQVAWEHAIRVPFAPEAPASGVAASGFFRACWYRRTFEAPVLREGERLVLHFGAVDYAATVWVNGEIAARHEGGYTPFRSDLTDLLAAGGSQEVVVRAEDDPHDLAKPRGKQDWLLEPHAIWYPRTTGIWQTVWLETTPATSLAALRWASNLERWEIELDALVEGRSRDDLRLRVKLHVGDLVLADDTYAVVAGEVRRRIALSDPGIDDYRNELLWSPPCPTLIEAEVQLWGRRGELVDDVRSYTALRSIGTQGDRFVLNGRPYSLRLVLDQGYWPETGLTPPDDEALRRDVELARAMGFNGVRKHQKIEDPRYLYWADTLGLLVWQEMPSAYRFTRGSVARLTREWAAAIDRDQSHPCIVAWVPFNESWGVPDLPAIAAQRHYVQGLYHLTKTLDPDRPVIGNDGWESAATDIVGIHDYDEDPQRLAHRYESDDRIARLFTRERPAGRLLTLEGHPHSGQPIMLTEFGGIACAEEPEGTWGYSRCDSPEELEQRYADLLAVVRGLPLFAGFCYTQFADTYQERNGLLFADRTPKVPLERISLATRGPRGPRDEQIQAEWRIRMMRFRRDHSVPDADAIGGPSADAGAPLPRADGGAPVDSHPGRARSRRRAQPRRAGD
ncbi:MAG: glycoside hydrolase family 2 protein [Gemmatimonadota bacterium]